MSRLNSRTSLSVLALAGLLQLQAPAAAAKARPEAGAVSDEDQSDDCLQDGLCRAHYTRARGLSKEGNYAGALAAYEAAYRRRPVPWLLINIGRTLHKLGKPADALAYYQRYREQDRDPAPERLKLLAQYVQQAEAEQAGAAAPPPTPPGADKPADSLPPPPTVPTESPAKPVRPPPAAPDAATAATPEGAKLTVGAGGAGSPRAAEGETGRDEPRPPSRPGRGLWAGLGVTGGLLLTGTALGITAQVRATQLQNTPYVGATPSAEIMGLQDQTRRTALAADVLFACTAVALGITLIATLAHKPAAAAALPAAGPPRRPSRPLPAPVAAPVAAPAAAPALGDSPVAPDLVSITGEVIPPTRPAPPPPAPAPPLPPAEAPEAPRESPPTGGP